MEFRNFAGRYGKGIILNSATFLPFNSKASEATLHSHFDMLHIVYIKSGRATCLLKDKAWQLSPGKVHIVMPGEMHSYYTESKNLCSAYVLYVTWFGKIPSVLPRIVNIPPARRKKINNTLQALTELFLVPQNHVSDLRKYALFSLILAEIMELTENQKAAFQNPSPTNSQDSRFKYVFKQLYGPPFKFPGLEHLAKHCGMSKRAFTSFFRKLTGMSAKQYFLRNVMTYAKMMIEENKFHPNQIAHQCGYSSTQNFLNAYRKYKRKAEANDKHHN
jgi:AraC-like DNA-binding protein